MTTENESVISHKEAERKQIIGIGVAIVKIDPSKNGENINNPVVWTNRELMDKKATGKISQQITIPSDTRKIGEGGFANILGTLAEFSADSNLIKNLYFINKSSYFNSKIWVKGNPFDFAVLVIDKPVPDTITPVDVDEVAPNGWMSLEDLRSKAPNERRSFVDQVIGSAGSRSVISDVVDDYFKFPERRIPLAKFLPQNFSMVEFFNKREKLSDVINRSGVIYEAKK